VARNKVNYMVVTTNTSIRRESSINDHHTENKTAVFNSNHFIITSMDLRDNIKIKILIVSSHILVKKIKFRDKITNLIKFKAITPNFKNSLSVKNKLDQVIKHKQTIFINNLNKKLFNLESNTLLLHLNIEPTNTSVKKYYSSQTF